MVELFINGKKCETDAERGDNLLWAIRENLNLKGTKYGCGEGVCGACTIHIDGQAVRSCQLTVEDAIGKSLTTIEGIPHDHPVKAAWISTQAPQCGYCQPGQIMQAIALLSKNPNPSREEVVEGMDDVLCRCGTYPRILKAIRKAAGAGGSK
ncbi:MAG: (2Fe-2S)-binding protein [Desulfomonilaceae bacterium]